MSPQHAILDDFLREFMGEDKTLADEADTFGLLGLEGDDAFEFMDKLAGRFDVDMSEYRWYFHHEEEGSSFNVGGLLFTPPYRRVERISITPDILTEAIRTRQWPVRYPVHTLSRWRWDILINQALALLMLSGLMLWAWRRFFA